MTQSIDRETGRLQRLRRSAPQAGSLSRRRTNQCEEPQSPTNLLPARPTCHSMATSAGGARPRPLTYEKRRHGSRTRQPQGSLPSLPSRRPRRPFKRLSHAGTAATPPTRVPRLYRLGAVNPGQGPVGGKGDRKSGRSGRFPMDQLGPMPSPSAVPPLITSRCFLEPIETVTVSPARLRLYQNVCDQVVGSAHAMWIKTFDCFLFAKRTL